ncbi:uncharacterized protein LOC127838001 isoform X2 [Dreissena polymorpha]|uniref:uncharacterized protein LOC127838001 isoform X2 n=1 Tax=Dreissena polymorpha TaxID=45954 RepID=UPI002263FBAA|nr:uncharacterized protein LOC127838001 isoform X2 [Dreissena polymorpha]
MDAIGEDTVTVDLILEYCKTVWEKRQCQNYLICSSFGTKILTKHIKDLKTKVADEVLDCCFMGLIKQEQSPMQYVSCAVMKVMFSGEQHAVSEVFYHHLHRIWVLDPLGELPATLKEILQLWKSYMAVRPEHQHRWKLLVKPHPKQLDSSSCGVFCVQFAEKILKGEPLKFPQDADSVVSYRLKMLQLIAMNQDPIEDICRLCGKSDLSEEWIGCDNCPKFWVHFNCLSKQVKTIRGQKYSLFAKRFTHAVCATKLVAQTTCVCILPQLLKNNICYKLFLNHCSVNCL